MPHFSKHMFICVNRRGADDTKGCCASKGAEDVLTAAKEALRLSGKGKGIRINRSGCLGSCAQGVAAVVYPEGVWYEKLRPEDMARIVNEHLIEGLPVSSLLQKADHE